MFEKMQLLDLLVTEITAREDNIFASQNNTAEMGDDAEHGDKHDEQVSEGFFQVEESGDAHAFAACSFIIIG